MDDVCKLVSGNKSTNKYGDVIPGEKVETEVFCKVMSVKRNEFYQASAVGMKPEVVLEVRQEDYSDETIVVYNDIEYKVLRTYPVGKKIVELVLTKDIYATS
ncbi:phage head closure protein [Anaerorhabdus furcosa]|uniref:Phage head-tail adaptor, putative, SPP1 family n=1 Tax=Anaerorhabdus furcosa TaxID=118967 RepID=A0A1T4M116_9FIRM|nr:phage head closure protein [Anaerorhabdus furcosa]SJZ60680.1 phage head-tail adaptor, putative, SPP1 family [Anaerorhabdus furcosa]